jgi:hypothetical protein
MKLRYPAPVIALACALIWWLGPPSATARQASATVRTNNSAPAGAPDAGSAPPRTKADRMREGLAALNDEDVVFYGKAVDQFGSPVPEATVAASIQVNNGVQVRVDRFSLVTDQAGSFTISGHKGKSLGIWVTKAGYVIATTKTSFVYSLLWPEAERHTPDPNSPVVIQMWKLQGAEPLVGIDKRLKLPCSRDPIRLDLLTGRVVADGGDLKIMVLRPEGVISQQHPQSWSIRLEIINGGFIRTTDEDSRVTYSAPEGGYIEGGDFPNNNGPDLVDQVFFIKSRGGQIYTKLQLTCRINNQPEGLMSLALRGVANTNRSRNWEATAPQPH